MSAEDQDGGEDMSATIAGLEQLRPSEATEWFAEGDENRVFAKVMKGIESETNASRERLLVVRPWRLPAATAFLLVLVASLVVCVLIHCPVA
jgi:hypothetical protein